MDSEAIQRFAFHNMCFELPREAIVNWLGQVIPETTGAGSGDG
jgi:hypothetical protein